MGLGQSEYAHASDTIVGPREANGSVFSKQESKSSLLTDKTTSKLVCRAINPEGELDTGEMRIGSFPGDISTTCGTWYF